MLRYPIRRLVWGLVAWSLAGCDSSRHVDVEMTLQRGSCASPECGEVIRGTGLLFTSAGRQLGSEAGEPNLYSEAVTGAGTTILLEVAFRGSIVDEVRFREVERSRVLYRGRILRQSFRPTTDGWAFALDTVDARAQGPNGPPPIVVRNGTIVRRASAADAEQVARDHADTDIEGGCGGSVVDTIAILPDPEDAEFDDPTFEDSDFEDADFEDADAEDPSPTDPPEDIQNPPPSTGEPPPPDDMDDDPPPPGFFDSDGGGCSGDTADDDSGGCDTDDEPDDEGGGCSGDEAPDDDDGGGGCGADDDGADSDDGGGCGGDDDSESDDGGGCEGDDDDGGCSGSSGSMSAVFTGRAVRGTFRLVWPVGLVAWVNRRMRRRCGLSERIAGGADDA